MNIRLFLFVNLKEFFNDDEIVQIHKRLLNKKNLYNAKQR